jgi:regulator of RNase E activity RraA
MADHHVERLRRLDGCAVSDALDALGIVAVALGIHRLAGDGRIAGRVVPVRLILAAPGAKSVRHLCTAAVEASGPDDVIVVANDGRTTVAGWGGNLSIAAAHRGVAGVIVDGACRDIDETRDVGLPLFARATVPVTARGRVVEQEWNRPVVVAGVDVAPGDLVLADGDGVVFVAATRADEVLGAAERIVAKERRMAADIRDGAPISAVMGVDYEQMLGKR